MFKPLPPDPKALDWPNTLQIAKLGAEIGQLHDIKRDRDPTAKAQIAEQIRQREGAQLYLYQQISGNQNVKTFGADEKRTIAGRLNDKITELSRERTYLSPRATAGGTSAELSPQVSRLNDQIWHLRRLAGLLSQDKGGLTTPPSPPTPSGKGAAPKPRSPST